MKNNSIKILGLAALLIGVGFTATSCGNDNVVNIWGPEEHEQAYLEAAKKYKETHPEFTATIKYAALGDAGANGNLSKDIETGAEIFTFPNDQLIDLKSMGALGKIPSANVEKMKTEQYSAAVEAGKFKDTYYAYPVTADNGFLFIYNKDAFVNTSVWDASKQGLKTGYTFRDLYKALDEKEATSTKWKNALCFWPAGTAWYQCGFHFAVGADYLVEFNDLGKQTKSTCDFAYTVGENSEKDYTKGLEAARCIVNSYTNEDGTVNKHFTYADDSTYNTLANNNSLKAEFEKNEKDGSGRPLAGIVCWNNGTLLTNWGDDYAVEVLPTLEAKCKQYGGTGTKYTMKSFSGFKLMGVNPFSKYARKSEENLIALHDFALYLTGYETSMLRYKANNAGPSNLEARKDQEIQKSKFLVKLNEQFELNDGNGYRIQDCVPQNFWTPLATFGNGLYNFVESDQNHDSFKNETAMKKQLFNLQKSICETVGNE